MIRASLGTRPENCLNPAHGPIVLVPESEDEVRVIAEFVQVVG